MKSLSPFITFLFAGLALACFSGGAREAGDKIQENRPVVDVVPVVRLEADSPLEVRLAIEAATDQPVKYLFGNDKLPMDLVSFHLLKDGKVLRSTADVPLTFLSERRVRELKPGDRLVHTLSLRERYGQLKPGMYTLEVRASGGPHDFGLSQIHLHKRLLNVEVVEAKVP